MSCETKISTACTITHLFLRRKFSNDLCFYNQNFRSTVEFQEGDMRPGSKKGKEGRERA